MKYSLTLDSLVPFMKKLIWIFLAGFIFSCQVQESELPLDNNEDESFVFEFEDEDDSARKKTAGDLGPTVIPSGVKPCATTTYDLFAGKKNDVGSVTIANDDKHLYVTYFTTKSFNKLHLWFGHSLSDLPRNPAGIPIIGHFFLKADAKGKNQYTFKISFTDLEKRKIKCGNKLIFVAHAEVGRESAFGGPTQIPGSNRWAYYMTHTLSCCDGGGDDNHPDPGPGLQVAYAKANWVFVADGCNAVNPECLPGLGIANTRWGWAINVTGTIGAFYDIWASADGNDINNGTKIGRLTVEYTTWQINGLPTAIGSITYQLNDGWVIQSLNLYTGDLRPTSSNPEDYGKTVVFPGGASTYSHNINFINYDESNDGVWFIAQAIVRQINP